MAAKRLTVAIGSDDTGQAAGGLEAILAALPATRTGKDWRIRQAIETAAAALRGGQDPLAAIEEAYRGRTR